MQSYLWSQLIIAINMNMLNQQLKCSLVHHHVVHFEEIISV